uniref:DNA breaking-rejoining enzyme n=1 Tax=Mycena chlorophos TaxID=658473 RepID=A0ABQ0KWE5_MYCCL|nr:predicted protein [Mycena chlorophos]
MAFFAPATAAPRQNFFAPSSGPAPQPFFAPSPTDPSPGAPDPGYLASSSQHDASPSPPRFAATPAPIIPYPAAHTSLPQRDPFAISSTLPALDEQAMVSDVLVGSLIHAFPSDLKSRRPKLGNAHRPSPLRPQVAARMRLLAWQTPYGAGNIVAHKHLPPADMAKSRASILASLAPNSQSTYAAGLLRFTQYCDRSNISEHLRMPAQPFLLCCFIADSIGSHGLKSAKNWLNGVAFWHHINLAPWFGDEPCVKKVLRAVDKDNKFVRPPRGPITLEHLRCIRSNLDLSSPFGAATWALATACFWGCRRLGELTVPTKEGFDPIYHASRASLISRFHSAGHEVISVHLPWTKTTRNLGGSLILTSTDDDVCPVWAFDNHTRINHSPSSNTPLFAYRNASSWIPIVKPAFLVFISNLFREAKLEQVLGHSFRIGGSVHLLCTGVEPEIVMKIGGWSSTCFLIYWRKLEMVIPVALARAWDKQRAAFCLRHGIEDEVDAEIDFVRLH